MDACSQIRAKNYQARKALRQALEHEGRDWSLLEATQESLREHMEEIKRLRELLEQQPDGKPVAWRWMPSKFWGSYVLSDDKEKAELAHEHGIEVEYLYTRPSQQLNGFANLAATTKAKPTMPAPPK